MDNNLIGYLLNALDADERRRTEEYLRDNADARRKLELLRASLAPLAADRTQPEPPAGLVERTMARISGVLVRPRIRIPVAVGEPAYAPSRWRRVDALVACCILVVLGGLGTSGLARLHQSREQTRCRDNLRQLHSGLMGYAQLRNGAFPFIPDRPPRNYAAAYQDMLVDAGQISPVAAINCPAVPTDTRGPSYAYTLGYRDSAGGLHGLRLVPSDGEGDLMPILADQPQALVHGRVFNVLFVGGHVLASTNRNIGAGGDDIYLSDDQKVEAGRHSRDSVLAPGNAAP
jgi:prepilin-type processing-associated H-X9-DG protein